MGLICRVVIWEEESGGGRGKEANGNEIICKDGDNDLMGGKMMGHRV